MIKKILNYFKKINKKILKILKIGLGICFAIVAISCIILITNMFFLHNSLFYELGVSIFQTSLYYIIFFIASAFTVDSILF